MKKIFSLALAVLMIASVIVMPSSAEETVEEWTEQSVVEVNALAFATKPTFDGVVSAEEWGEYTVEVKGSEAADASATTYNYANSIFKWDDGVDPNADTTLYPTGKTGLYGGVAEKMSYKMWFRWDAEYYYIAAQVNDPDGYSAQNNRGEIWNGDCFQFRLDPTGPNGIMKFADSTYDYKTTPFNFPTNQTPWSNPNSVVSIGSAWYNNNGKVSTQVYEMTKKLVLGGGRISNGVEKESLVGIVPASEENGMVTTYELAIPWETIFVHTDTDKFEIDPETNTSNQVYTGKVLGMSVSLLNAAAGQKNFNAYLNWGCGITGAQHNKDSAFAKYVNGGSNAIVLSDVNALNTSETVSGLPTQGEAAVIPFKEQAVYASAGGNSNYLGLITPIVEDGYTVEVDVAPLAHNITDPETGHISFWLGQEPSETEGQKPRQYFISAGYDFYTQTFVISNSQINNGFKDAEQVIARSEKFDWAIPDAEAGTVGEWHRLGIRVENKTVTLYLDGKEVLKDTNDLYGVTAKYEGIDDFTTQAIIYGNVERVFDNLFYGKLSYEMGSGVYTEENTYSNTRFDADDMAFHTGPIKRQFEGCYELIELDCTAEEKEYNVGHNCTKIKAATAEKVLIGCYYCDDASTERLEDNNGRSEPFNEDKIGSDVLRGDADKSGKVNVSDAVIILRANAKWEVEIDEAAADVTGDGKVNVTDAVYIMRALSSWPGYTVGN